MKKTRSLLTLLLLVNSVPVFSFTHHHKKAHRVSWFEFRIFVPSKSNLLTQNAVIDSLGLPRIQNDLALQSLIASEDLVPITQNEYVRVSPRLEKKRRFCRPWVDAFLQELGQQYYARFHEPIQVNSAVRTIKTQTYLLRVNHNAAPAHGETASAHLAGIAVDLQRRGLTRQQIRFIQQKLLYLTGLHMVIVEEELRQPCFHVVVTGEYPFPPSLETVLSSNQETFRGIFDINNPILP